jgi:hypothetical protein
MAELIENRERRVKLLKEIIGRLHDGARPDEVKGKLRTLIGSATHAEIMAMEQELMAEGMPARSLQGLCDLHSQVLREILVQLPRPVAPGHPVDTFRRENEAICGVLRRMRAAIAEIAGLQDGADASSVLLNCRQGFNELMDLEKHYQRKEHLLFSCLERHGITGPSKVMWGKDDEIRMLLKDLGRTLGRREGNTSGEKLVPAAETAICAIEEMIYKEENILFPLCLDKLSEEEWAEIWASSPRYGWCLIEPQTGYQPPATHSARVADPSIFQLPTGNLDLQQLLAIFTTLPVNLTFVDADDRVRFYSEGPDRIFARSKAIIGRKVQYCHPPHSVDTVDRILNDFRDGRQSVAEFWLDLRGRFIHVRYFAVRGENREYLGTLEVTQDVTRIRSLTGERRLLQYDGAAVGKTAA